MGEYIKIGTLISGRYEIVEKIGSGGMAIVYKAKCRLLNRFVAVKVLRPEFKDDEEFLSKFNIESQAAASLSHPNVVSIFDVGCDDEIHYIVMEYVEGITLKEYIQKNGPIEWRTAAGYATQICKALEHAHKHNIVHRDIKPQNIIMTKDGTLKVTDFGIARAVTSSTVVVGSNAIGSAHYFSPEQARGGYTDEKSDIYSLGIVMFEMLTGRLPFDGDSPVSVALMQVQAMPPSMTEIKDDIPESIQNIVYKAINKEQRERYQSASVMLMELNSLFEESDYSQDNTKNNSILEAFNMSKNKKNKKAKAPITKQDRIITLSAVAAGLVVVFVIGAFMFSALGFSFNFGKGSEVEVPSIVNMDLETANAMLKDTKLELVQEGELPSDTVEKGLILEQDPAAGRMVKVPSEIKVKISAGAKMVKVPSVVDMEKRSAVLALEAQDLVASITETPSEIVPEGIVISQIPDAGVEIKAGEVVRLYVSGKATSNYVNVPNLVGKTEKNARGYIEEAELVMGEVDYKETDEKEEGIVISQTPSFGLSVEKKSAVNIVISKKPSEPQNTVSASEEPTPTISTKVKTLTIPVPQDKDKTQIRIVANGKEIHNKLHNKEELAFDIKVTGTDTAVVEIYHDGVLKSTQNITF